MSELPALVAFALVGSITPGPNNALLLGSGIRFGFRRTARHVAGTAMGMGALVFAVAGGVGVVVLALPGAELALKLVGSAYLLCLALRIAGSSGIGGAVAPRPLGVVAAAAFQLANPKGWLFALTAAATFLPPGLTPLVGGLAVAATCAVVILGTAAVWAAGGVALGRVASGGRIQQGINVALALVLAASVVLVWT
jgi:threonine/homoserine/homoserine lactone efflux protein